MSDSPILDIFGRELNAGDTIAMAFPQGNSATQRVGKIVEFIKQNNSPRRFRLEDGSFEMRPVPPSPVMVVDWSGEHGEHLPGKPSKITKFHGRIVKLT